MLADSSFARHVQRIRIRLWRRHANEILRSAAAVNGLKTERRSTTTSDDCVKTKNMDTVGP